MHVVSHRIWIKCIVYPLMYQKNAFFAPVFTLRSKVDLILTRAIGPIIAESAQFSKIVKKLNIDFCQFFSHWKEALFLLKSWNKIWGSPYSLLRQSCRKCTLHAFSPIFERGLGRVDLRFQESLPKWTRECETCVIFCETSHFWIYHSSPLKWECNTSSWRICTL